MKKVLIFDYDGVIADSFAIVFSILKELAAKIDYKGSVETEDLRELFDKNPFRMIREKGLSLFKVMRLAKEMKTEIMTAQSKIKFFPEIPKIIERLSRKNELYIVTSNSAETVRNRISEYSLDSYFKEIYGVETSKSKVKKIKKITSQYPSGTVFYYIGDTNGDMIEGKKAGTITVGAAWGYHDETRLKRENPDFILTKPNQLLGLLEN